MLYGWLLCGFFTLITGAVIAEICSVYPVAGGMYYWAGALAKREKAAEMSYITGWIYFTSYTAMMSSFSHGLAKIIVGFYLKEEENEWLKVFLSLGILLIWCL